MNLTISSQRCLHSIPKAALHTLESPGKDLPCDPPKKKRTPGPYDPFFSFNTLSRGPRAQGPSPAVYCHIQSGDCLPRINKIPPPTMQHRDFQPNLTTAARHLGRNQSNTAAKALDMLSAIGGGNTKSRIHNDRL